MNIGYIGLGLMGTPCALNLIKAGHTLFVWVRRKEAADAVVAKGATLCASPAETAARVDILFTNVTNAVDVEAVLFAENGVVASGKKGLVIVDMSTISATASRKIAKRVADAGMEFIDSPVSGGTAGAEKGTLSFMAGGSAATIERITPVLRAMGTTITRIGDSGAGQVAKSCNQIALTASIIGVAEAIRFAKANGVDPAPVRAALMGGLAGSRVLEMHGHRIIEDTYEPGFKTALHLKDMNIIDDIIKELGLDMPVTGMGRDYLDEAVRRGYGDEDSAIIAKVMPTTK